MVEGAAAGLLDDRDAVALRGEQPGGAAHQVARDRSQPGRPAQGARVLGGGGTVLVEGWPRGWRAPPPSVPGLRIGGGVGAGAGSRLRRRACRCAPGSPRRQATPRAPPTVCWGAAGVAGSEAAASCQAWRSGSRMRMQSRVAWHVRCTFAVMSEVDA